jgi:hypothetical protein
MALTITTKMAISIQVNTSAVWAVTTVAILGALEAQIKIPFLVLFSILLNSSTLSLVSFRSPSCYSLPPSECHRCSSSSSTDLCDRFPRQFLLSSNLHGICHDMDHAITKSVGLKVITI